MTAHLMEAIAEVVEEMENDGNGWHAKIRWLYNPVPVGERLYWPQPQLVAAPPRVERAKAWQPPHDGIRDALAAVPPDGEWRGFAAECAQQYGAEYLDDDAKLVVMTEENLVNMMAVIGYPTRRSAPQVGRPCPAPTHHPQLVSPDDDTIVEAMEFSCSQRPSVDDDSYVLGILKIFLDAARPLPTVSRACNNDECGWQGPESEAVHPKHDPSQRLCPRCHETTEPTAAPPRVERFALIGDPGAECVRNGHGYWELHRDGKLVCPLSPQTRQFVESALAARSRA